MKQAFGENSPLMMAARKIISVLLVNMLWIVTSIPLVTIGASTAACYDTVYKDVWHHRGTAFFDFFSAFRKNFRQSLVVGVVFAAAALILGYDIYTLHSLSVNGLVWGKFWVLILIFSAWLSAYFIYVCAYIARFEAPLQVIVSNSLKLSISHLPVTLALIMIVAAVVLGVWLWPKTLAFLPAVGMLLCTRLISGVFRRYMTEEERNAEDEKNESWKLLRKSAGSK